MIERYSRPEMAQIWTEHAQFRSWLDVELAACDAWSRLGVIPRDDVERLYANAGFDIDRIHEIEESTRHDVVAFTRAVSETLGDERKWVHYGLTSSDVVDTAWSVRLLAANKLIRESLVRFRDVLAKRAVALQEVADGARGRRVDRTMHNRLDHTSRDPARLVSR